MNLQKLNPWNWFKHEESHDPYENTIPVKKKDYAHSMSNRNAFLELHSAIDKLFEQTFQNFGFPPLLKDDHRDARSMNPFKRSSLFVPDLNISSDEKEYVITLEMAGMEQKDLEIELTERRLSIKGNKQEEAESKEKDFYRIERKFGSFQRVLALPEDAVGENIKAHMKNGLLTLKIPRAENQVTPSKKITIENN